jgi:hypothetical protein
LWRLVVQLRKRTQGNEKYRLWKGMLEHGESSGSSLFTLVHIDSCLLFPARRKFPSLGLAELSHL